MHGGCRRLTPARLLSGRARCPTSQLARRRPMAATSMHACIALPVRTVPLCEICSCCCWVLELVDIYSGASRSTSICSCWCCWCCCCGGGCCCHLAPAPGRPSTHRATLQRSPCTAAASRPAIEWGTSATDQRAQTEPTCQVAAPLRLAAGPGPGPGQGQE